VEPRGNLPRVFGVPARERRERAARGVAGGSAAGWIFDLSGSYRLPFVLSIASYLGGGVAFWALRRPARW
jgi:hypothetical protein